MLEHPQHYETNDETVSEELSEQELTDIVGGNLAGNGGRIVIWATNTANNTGTLAAPGGNILVASVPGSS